MTAFVFIVCYFSIDATNDGNLGRYVNDAPRKFANCTPKTLMISGCHHVCLFAVKDIRADVNSTKIMAEATCGPAEWNTLSATNIEY